MTDGTQAGLPTSATRLVLLVSAAVFINYIDRGNLATAPPLIQDELHLSERTRRAAADRGLDRDAICV